MFEHIAANPGVSIHVALRRERRRLAISTLAGLVWFQSTSLSEESDDGTLAESVHLSCEVSIHVALRRERRQVLIDYPLKVQLFQSTSLSEESDDAPRSQTNRYPPAFQSTSLSEESDDG